MKTARILILFPHITMPGGALNYSLKLANELCKQGNTVAILALQINPAYCADNPDVEFISVNAPLSSSVWYWLLFPFWQYRIQQTILSWQPDIIVPQVFPANWWGWFFKRSHSETRLVWICHEPSAFIHSLPWIKALSPIWKSWLALVLRPFLAMADIRLCRYTDKIIANSIFTAGMVQRIYGKEADAVAYPGFDVKDFHPDVSEKRSDIITVARLTGFKRIDFLLRVFALLSAQHPDLIFNIVGRGEDEHTLKILAEELGISTRVIFHGSVDNQTLIRLNQRSLLFLHGSLNEPFGMAPLEAIACGTPVVAHRSGGPLEIIDSTCGRLIDSISAERWSDEIDNYMNTVQNQDGYFERVSSRARKFTWETTLVPIVSVINNLMESGISKTRTKIERQ